MYEFELLTKLGMTPFEAYRCSTVNAAKLCQIDAEYGTLTAGKVADFIVLDSDLLELLGELRMQIILKELQQDELTDFWELAFSNPHAEWTKWNGPYFHDKLPSKDTFIDSSQKNVYLNNPLRKVIWNNNQMVGMVFAYYADEPLEKWLEVGISIYRQANWQQGIGRQALTQWITELFKQSTLPHLGLTTWSGNYRMIALAESLNLKKEAEIRQVRYWQGKYWDSIKYGILRTKWTNKNKTSL